MEILIDKYIEELKKNYIVNEIHFRKQLFNRVFQIKSKGVISLNFLIIFAIQEWHEETKDEIFNAIVEIVNEFNKKKPTPCILICQSNIVPNELLHFNGDIYVHLVLFDFDKQLHYERNFYYLNASKIKNAIKFFYKIIK